MKPAQRVWYKFGPFRLCPSESALLRDGRELAVSPRTFDTLAWLVKSSPNLVTVEELIAGVWDNLSVEPNNVTQHVFSARKLLGDSSQSPTYIQNVPRRGYRFIAPVETYEEESVQASSAPPVIAGPMEEPVAFLPELPTAPAEGANKKRIGWLIAAGAAAVVLIAAPLAAFLPVSAPEMRITGYRQLTHDGGQKEGPLLIKGGEVIYRSMGSTARMWAIPMKGGEGRPLGTAGEIESDVSADGKTLLFSSMDSNGGTLWSRRFSGGDASLLVDAETGSWSPDGQRLATADANALCIYRGSTLRSKILVTGQAWNPRWSPDGSRIRFSVLRANEAALWEVNADGSQPHAIKENSAAPVVRDGVWNAAGNLFFFTAHTSGADNIWVARERRFGRILQESEPVALTNGPGDWRWPTVSDSAKQIFAIHSVTEPQLTSLDLANKEWRPFWQGPPIYEMEFSRNGETVAFIQYSDHTLWKAKADGSARVQLTHEEVEAHEPHWSPDGSRIAFMSRRRGGPWRAAIISSEGGTAEEAVPFGVSGIGQGVPTWSPDGRAILFGDRTEAKPGPRMNIHYVDLATHKLTDLPNSYGLWSPRWSPDGKYIAAPSFDSTNLQVMKWPGGEWKNVLRLRAIEDMMWSADSKYIYFKGRKTVDCSELYRLRIADNALEMIVDLKDFRWPAETWFGLTPSGTPLALFESSPQEVFAINYEAR